MLWWFAQNTLITGLLAAAVWLACRLRRPGPAVQHALWLVVLVKLVTPPVIVWPWAAPECLRSLGADSAGLVDQLDLHDAIAATARGGWGRVGETAVREPAHSSRGLADSTPATLLPAEVNSVIGEFAPLPDSAASRDDQTLGAAIEPTAALEWLPVPAGSITQDDFYSTSQLASKPEPLPPVRGRLAWRLIGPMVLRLWWVGAAVMVLIQTLRIIRFCRMTAKSRTTPDWLVRQVERVAAKVEVRPPHVLVVPGIRSPFIWCAWRPRLLWPACLTDRTDSDRWRGVIAHELAHLRRHDHWVGWLELLAGCLWWWNPLLWYVRYQLRENAELACDALVVSVLPDGRRAYAESLIEVASLVSLTAAPMPAFGVHSVARQTFERRLTMILCERVPSKLSVRAMFVIGLLGLVALPGWSLAQVAAPAKNQQPAALAEPETNPGEIAAPELAISAEVSVEPALGLFVVPADPFVVQTPSGDQRIETIESKLEQLLAEVKALREERKGSSASGRLNVRAAPAATPRIVARKSAESQAATTNWWMDVNVAPAQHSIPTIDPRQADVRYYVARALTEQSSNVQLLSRATYKLPKAKAEALAAFLGEFMKSSVEAKADDDSLIVTATPEAQAAIGGFIALSEGKQPAAAGSSWPYQLTRPAQNLYAPRAPQQAAPAVPPPVEPAKAIAR